MVPEKSLFIGLGLGWFWYSTRLCSSVAKSWILGPAMSAKAAGFILFSQEEHGNQFFPISVMARNPFLLGQLQD